MKSLSQDIKEEAVALTKEALVFDVYTCSPQLRWTEKTGWFSRFGNIQMDLPKMIEGGIDAAGFSLWWGPTQNIFRPGVNWLGSMGELDFDKPDWYVFSWPSDPYLPYKYEDYMRSPLAWAMMQYELWMREVEASNGKMVLTKTASEVAQAEKEGKIGVMIHGNNIIMIEDCLDVLRVLFRLGYRMMILGRLGRNLVADGYCENRTKSRLTTFGVGVVEEMNRLGMLIDVSHLSDSCTYDVVEVSKDPVIASHSNSRALCNHPRNLTDDQLKALTEKGGKVGLTFVPSFIDLKAEKEKRGYDVESPLFQKFLDHCNHFADVIGADNIMIGSDFDGGGTLLKDASEMPKITEGLLSRGYSKQKIKKILGENALSIIKKVIG